MTTRAKIALSIALLALVGLGVAVKILLDHGFSAREEPTAVEKLVARRLRHLAVPRNKREQKNPVPLTAEVLREARAHFADHCASCHDNDGRGRTQIGQGLYPKAPDMTLSETQSLSDGELFYIIENGVRLTGMPAWGNATPESAKDSWELVHFVRHLPKITPEEVAEMEDLNPKSCGECAEEEARQRFLEGGGEAPAAPTKHEHH